MKPLNKLPIPLMEWYRDNKRDLPWRRDPTPYHVWIAEIMLQQTRVAAATGYYTRFLDALPDIEALAGASEDALLKLWQGLGYYHRARNLHKAAQQVMERFGGQFPACYEDIRSLPGIGDYTAAAIASIAFGLPYPAVDGNLLRICARVSGDDTDITTPAMSRKITAALSDIIPLAQPGAFNQAMMDLGATVCLPNGAPLCPLCPLKGFCLARRENRTDTLPVRAKKKPRRVEERAVLLLFHEGQVALRQRGSKGLLAGLWEYPNVPEGEAAALLAELGLPSLPEPAGHARHIFSHIEWHMQAYVLHRFSPELPKGWLWADAGALSDTFAIPSAFSAFAILVERGLACFAMEENVSLP